MTAHDAPVELAERYARWLRLLPPTDRARSADEMLATYLRTVPPGRRRPTVADRLDVARYAARRWWHALGAPADVRPEASATVAWLLAAALSYAAVRALVLGVAAVREGWALTALAPLSPSWALWPVVVVALLCGSRRVAGATAAAAAALGAGALVGVVGDGERLVAVYEVGWVVAQVVVAVAALRAGARPRRRVRVVTVLVLVVGSVLGLVTAADLTGVLPSGQLGLRLAGGPGVSALVGPAALALVAVLGGRVERHALSPLAAVLAVLVVGRDGGLLPGSTRWVPMTGPPLDAATLLPLVGLPVLVLVAVRLVVAAADRAAQPRRAVRPAVPGA
ncbi:MAG: hypothetical protein J7503_04545 [Cellulomonas iranensis]|uniref:hypothetical protein n=1 Tax=Cellulomonas iranensis TaxID=76862 RepID=UPI001B1BF7B1|nr:hypothetical protein [Cellulomonas iranensis]MBO9568074.1 hypothetical protein [Cellulomonas iranensis]